MFRGIRMIVLAAIVMTIAAACSAPAKEEDRTGSTPVVTDEQFAALEDMNQHAERAYQSMKEGDVENARNRMIQLSASATRLSYEGLTSIEGINALTESIGTALHSLNAVQPDEHESLIGTARVRLAVDALAHPKQPMWLEFYKPLSEDLSEVKQSAAKQDERLAADAMLKWTAHVKLIRPALLISRDASYSVKLDSMTTFLDSSVRKKDWSNITQSIPNLSASLKDIFSPADQETIAPLAPTEEPPHPILWSLSLGSIIIAVLAYVAWRRYPSRIGYYKVKKEQDFDRGF